MAEMPCLETLWLLAEFHPTFLPPLPALPPLPPPRKGQRLVPRMRGAKKGRGELMGRKGRGLRRFS